VNLHKENLVVCMAVRFNISRVPDRTVVIAPRCKKYETIEKHLFSTVLDTTWLYT
jgi:hypothetical protein